MWTSTSRQDKERIPFTPVVDCNAAVVYVTPKYTREIFVKETEFYRHYIIAADSLIILSWTICSVFCYVCYLLRLVAKLAGIDYSLRSRSMNPTTPEQKEIKICGNLKKKSYFSV